MVRGERLHRLHRRLGARGMLVTHSPNLHYLVGFRGSSAALLVSGRETILFTDGRYRTAARAEVRGARIRIVRGSPLQAAAGWIRRRKFRRLFFEEEHLTVAERRVFQERLGPGVELEPSPWRVESWRAVKDAGEIAAIRAAVELTARVFEEILPCIRPGVRERELAAEIEYRMKLHGSDQPAFETIVASGARAALPHGRASEKRLAKNELVVFDLGAILAGYQSDMTRTVYLGRPPARVERLYRAVQDAQARACEMVRAGVEAGRVDAAARGVLTSRGYGRYFVHGTGHGLGLETHEEPRVGPGVRTRLRAGEVITVEPGAYLPGWGGVRVEDVLVVTRGGAEILTPLSTELLCL